MSKALQAEQMAGIAELARLRFDATESEAYAHDLRAILELVDAMQGADTRDVKPLAHPLDALQPLRADEVTEDDQRQSLMANAPQQEAGLFLVPRVIE